MKIVVEEPSGFHELNNDIDVTLRGRRMGIIDEEDEKNYEIMKYYSTKIYPELDKDILRFEIKSICKVLNVDFKKMNIDKLYEDNDYRDKVITSIINKDKQESVDKYFEGYGQNISVEIIMQELMGEFELKDIRHFLMSLKRKAISYNKAEHILTRNWGRFLEYSKHIEPIFHMEKDFKEFISHLLNVSKVNTRISQEDLKKSINKGNPLIKNAPKSEEYEKNAGLFTINDDPEDAEIGENMNLDNGNEVTPEEYNNQMDKSSEVVEPYINKEEVHKALDKYTTEGLPEIDPKVKEENAKKIQKAINEALSEGNEAEEEKKDDKPDNEPKKDDKDVCNICHDPKCTRRIGQPKTLCIHHNK